ncbi:MAG TPA: alpha-L-fucosidase, partial [Ktedonobacteraceae bacterium]|nr:alpha-L-fucosidase [Ktedonobacteraceae bacterium]
EWYSRNMYVQDSVAFQHHQQTYGSQTTFGYKDFIPMFKGEHFSPDAWVSLFKQAGAKFVVPVAEHHDGFALYNCSFSSWNSVQMGPGRDILGELATAIRQQGLVFGLSYHRAEHWWFFNGGRAFPSDVQDPQYRDFYGPAEPEPDQNPPDKAFLDDWLARICELIEKYQPQQIYFDWWIERPVFQTYLPRIAAYYYNRAAQWQRGVVINYKRQDFPNLSFADGTAVFDIERGQMTSIAQSFWQGDTSVSHNSWCYVENQNYKTVASLINDLVDIVSKNGTMLLNVGPSADGTLAETEVEILQGIGRWLDINGEAIYASRPWKIFGEGPTEIPGGSFSDGKRPAFTSEDIRFTTQGPVLYAVLLDWPENGIASIKSLAAGSELYPSPISTIELLGSSYALTWTRAPESLLIHLPAERPCENAVVFKISPLET